MIHEIKKADREMTDLVSQEIDQERQETDPEIRGVKVADLEIPEINPVILIKVKKEILAEKETNLEIAKKKTTNLKKTWEVINQPMMNLKI